jgi:tRNA(Arg) A34 adenosine deaminase TadA
VRFPKIQLELPPWIESYLANSTLDLSDRDGRMDLVIGLARQNVLQNTGGPFGAAIFNADTHELIAPGVNRVVGCQCSVAHAEIMAIMLAQKCYGTFDLAAAPVPACELVTSTEPCAMCLGAIPWSGVRVLVCGACDEDARRIGFDEGSKPAAWVQQLEQRGIQVFREVQRAEAAAVLDEYAVRGGPIYNSQQQSS